MKQINKIPVFEWFYEQGDVYVSVHLGSSDLLVLPPAMHDKKIETFVIGNASTPNLTFDEEGIKAPMRFGNNFFNCFFPWESIIMFSGQSAVMQFATEEKIHPPPEKKDKGKGLKEGRRKGHLRIVK